MMFLDLDELPTLFKGRFFWSASGRAIARFRRRDHLGSSEKSLASAVRDRVEQEAGARPTGPIRLLTNLSYFGYCFNPVSFYYCYSASGTDVEYIVSEVNSTPWGERDVYVMDCRHTAKSGSAWRFQPTKKMHVSPFMSMELEYDWVLSAPGEGLSVFMANSKNGIRFFDATLSLKRRQISTWSLSRVLLRFPLMTCKIIFAIYWEALRLWIKRCPVYAHPDKNKEVVAR